MLDQVDPERLARYDFTERVSQENESSKRVVNPVNSEGYDNETASSSTPRPALESEAHEVRLAIEFLAWNYDADPAQVWLLSHYREYAQDVYRRLWVVTLLESESHTIFHLIVDPDTGRVSQNYEIRAGTERAEREYRERHGGIGPRLAERMATAEEDERIEVHIWWSTSPGPSIEQLARDAERALIARYPEARAAHRRGRRYFAVDDLALRDRLRREYGTLIERGLSVQLERILGELKAEGIEATTIQPGRILITQLTRTEIASLVGRPWVIMIYLGESQFDDFP